MSTGSKTRLVLAAGAATMLLQVGARAGEMDWIEFARTTDGSTYSYHLPRTKYIGDGAAETWVRSVHKSDQFTTEGRRPYRSSVALQTVSCRYSTVTEGAFVLYSKTGSTVLNSPGSGIPMRQAPDTVGDALVRLICADSRAK